MIANVLLSCVLSLASDGSANDEIERFELKDVFELEYAADPRISANGEQVVYVRRFMDVMTDRSRSNIWIINADGSDHRPLTTGKQNDSNPRWSPDQKRLVYTSSIDGSSQLYVRWMDTTQTAKITNLHESASDLAWSPDGEWIAFTMFVERETKPLAKMPKKPEGAEWAPDVVVITQLRYRADGEGYLTEGSTQIFIVPAEGGTPRQLTTGDHDAEGPLTFTPDGSAILFTSNRGENAEFEPINSEVFELKVADGSLKALTNRYGPDSNPLISPDGKQIAYFGFADRHQGYQVVELHLMNRDGVEPVPITSWLDRSISDAVWAADSSGLYLSYSDNGESVVAFQRLGEQKALVRLTQLGGTTLGRPYSSGSFSVSDSGRVAYTMTTPGRPSDIAIVDALSVEPRRITNLNEDLFANKELGAVEELRFKSSHDDLDLQGWIVKPPGFESGRKYPLVLEIHGGPFANYGPRFSAECQLYAAAGYVVLYMNPRGSTSYGAEFGNLIHHAYPGNDYDDLMSGVDAVIAKGYVDPEQLFVTGGSGGGVLTAWIVGKTDRFRAAVVAKPVINWTSFALTADAYTYFHKYWFPGYPWEEPEHYWARSPLSLVGHVTTPTMLLTGEVDYRTPISESEQYFQALKLQKVDTAMVRIPEASHGIASRPSNLIAKVAHILAWFAR